MSYDLSFCQFHYFLILIRLTLYYYSLSTVQAVVEVGGTESSLIVAKGKGHERVKYRLRRVGRGRVSKAKAFPRSKFEVAAGVGKLILANQGSPFWQSGDSDPCP